MGVELAITDYNLTLIPQPPPDSGRITVDAVDLAPILHDPVIAEEPWRAVSARDQLSVVLRPPAAAVIDHNGAPPARPGMIAATAGLIELLKVSRFSIQAYGWNIRGELIGVEPGNTMKRFIDARRIADAASNPDGVWSVPQLTLSASGTAVGADRVNVTFQVSVEPDGQESLRFDANAHYEHAPDVKGLRDEGATAWATFSEIIKRLTADAVL